MVRKHYLVTGRVQGVGFRNFVFKQARGLGLVGLVRNLDDGRVEILAQGDESAMKAFDAAVARGPMLANVKALDAKNVGDVEPLSTAKEFTVSADGEAPWPVD